MTNLIAYNNDGIEIYIDDVTGKGYFTAASYARLSGRAESTISDRKINPSEKMPESPKVPTATGFKTPRLIDETTAAKWLPKDNPEMATKMILLGIRKFMHTLAGYSQPQQQVAPQQQVPVKALPSEYDLKLKNIRDRKNAATKDIHELQVIRLNVVYMVDFTNVVKVRHKKRRI